MHTSKQKEIKKVALIYKRSVYQKYVLEENNPKVKKFLRSKNRWIRPIKRNHNDHYKTIEEVERFIKKTGIIYKIAPRHKFTNLNGYDLVITLGGDGTFLRTAHRIKDQLIMGINSVTRVSVGALCSATHEDYKEKLLEIFDGDYKIKKFPLMRITINDKLLPIQAVNDVLFANTSTAAMSRYFLQLKGIREEHKSSGIWIATSTGSRAALHAAGGIKMPRQDKRLQFVVREPYQGIFNAYRLLRGFIEKRQRLTIFNKMFLARAYIDGPATYYEMSFGDEISFQPSTDVLRVVW